MNKRNDTLDEREKEEVKGAGREENPNQEQDPSKKARDSAEASSDEGAGQKTAADQPDRETDGDAFGEEVSDAAEGDQREAEGDELQAKYMRLAADFQNFKRRTEKEKGEIYARANEKIVLELLEVVDNFERALLHTDGTDRDAFAEGMNMIFKQFKGVLEKSGVEEINAEGEDFDPNFHHAVMTENSVEYESGKVTQVLQRGYLLNGRVIRPAMVKVAE